MTQINNELRDRAYKCACDHGFHEKKYPTEHWLTLIITEISEAVNADRKEKYSDINHFKKMEENELIHWDLAFERCVKDSVEDELSDVVIRCLDFAKEEDIDISDLDEIIKNDDVQLIEKSFTEKSFEIIEQLVTGCTLKSCIKIAICYTFSLANSLDIDLLWHIEQKMRYNEMRPMLNGKKY